MHNLPSFKASFQGIFNHPTDPSPTFDARLQKLLKGQELWHYKLRMDGIIQILGWNSISLIWLDVWEIKKSKSLFVFDNTSCHQTEEVKNAFEEYHINYETLSKSYTVSPTYGLINQSRFSKQNKEEFHRLVSEKLC